MVMDVAFATLAAIFLQLAAAQSSDLSFIVSPASMATYNGTSSRSTIWLLGGKHSSGSERKSLLYVETKGQFKVQEYKSGRCKYTALVFVNGNEDAPVLGYLEDNCAIKNDSQDIADLAMDKTFELFFDGGSCKYDVKSKCYGFNLSDFDQLNLPKLPTSGSSYTISHAKLATYRGTSDRSNIFFLNGRDYCGIKRGSIIFVESKGNVTVQEENSGTCIYTAHVFANGNRKPPVLGYFEDDCAIRNGSLDRDTFPLKTYTVFYGGGSSNITYKAKSGSFSLPVSKFDKLNLPNLHSTNVDTSGESYSICNASLNTYMGKDNKSSIWVLSGKDSSGKEINSTILVDTDDEHTIREDISTGRCKYTAYVNADDDKEAPSLGYFEDNCEMKNYPSRSYDNACHRVFEVFLSGGSSYITYRVRKSYYFPKDMHQSGLKQNFDTAKKEPATTQTTTTTKLPTKRKNTTTTQTTTTTKLPKTTKLSTTILFTSGSTFTVSDAKLITYKGTPIRSSIFFLNGGGSCGFKMGSIIFVETKGDVAIQEDNSGRCNYTAHVFANGNNRVPVLGYFKDDCAIRNWANGTFDYESFPRKRKDYNWNVFFDGGSSKITYKTGSRDFGSRVSEFDRLKLPSLHSTDLPTFDLQYQVCNATLHPYQGTDSRSSVWVLGGKDTNGIERKSAIFVETKGDFEVIENVAGTRCKYTAHVYANGESEAPVLGYLEDNCDIKEFPGEFAEFATDLDNIEVFFSEGSSYITYSVQKSYHYLNLKISDFDKLELPKLSTSVII